MYPLRLICNFVLYLSFVFANVALMLHIHGFTIIRLPAVSSSTLPTLWPLPPFLQGSALSLVRAYFGAKKIDLLRRLYTHPSILAKGSGCRGP